MNDLMNNVLDRYQAFKKGDRSASAEINPAFAKNGSRSKTAAKAAPAPNLIDFDEPVPDSASNGGASSNPIDDAFGLGGLTLGPSASSSNSNAPVLSNSNGGGLLDGLDFGSPSVPQQQQSSFYQQYQTTTPSGAVQQPTVSWGNLNAQPGARTASPMNANTYGQQGNSAFSMPSPNSAGKASAAVGQNSLRPVTPGAINLGMMGGVPPSSPMGMNQNRHTPQPAQQQQAQQSSSNQPPKVKDPFDDLLSF